MLGALLGFLATRLAALHKDAGSVAPVVRSNEDFSTIETRDQVQDLEQQVQLLSRRIRTLQARIGEEVASSEPAANPAKIALANSRARFRSLGSRYAELCRRVMAGEIVAIEDWKRLEEQISQVVIELMGPCSASGRQAYYSPGGTPVILLGCLEAIPPGLSDRQVALIEKALGRVEDEWFEETRRWKDSSQLERDLASLELETIARQAILAHANPDQVRAAQILDKQLSSGTCDVAFLTRDRETFPGALAELWSERLVVDEIQRRELAGIATLFRDDYEREFRDLKRGLPPGTQPDWRTVQCAEIRVMVAARERMKERLNFSPSQQAFLDSWEEIFSWTEE